MEILIRILGCEFLKPVTDVWSFAASPYQLLTGKFPYRFDPKRTRTTQVTQAELKLLEDCLRYLGNRSAHLGYAKALAEGLPIGSGAVESGHRSVLQKRLKMPGAWWVRQNAEAMAQLKTLQANGLWDNLSATSAQKEPFNGHGKRCGETPGAVAWTALR